MVHLEYIPANCESLLIDEVLHLKSPKLGGLMLSSIFILIDTYL